MKYQNQARLAIYNSESHIMLSWCLTFQGAKQSICEKFNSNVAAKRRLNLFSDFYWFVNFVIYIALVSLKNANISSGLFDLVYNTI